MNPAPQLRLAAATRCVQPIAHKFTQLSIFREGEREAAAATQSRTVPVGVVIYERLNYRYAALPQKGRRAIPALPPAGRPRVANISDHGRLHCAKSLPESFCPRYFVALPAPLPDITASLALVKATKLSFGRTYLCLVSLADN